MRNKYEYDCIFVLPYLPQRALFFLKQNFKAKFLDAKLRSTFDLLASEDLSIKLKRVSFLSQILLDSFCAFVHEHYSPSSDFFALDFLALLSFIFFFRI